MLALVTTVTLVFPLFLANSKAARQIRSAPGRVSTLKSTARSSSTWIPLLPQMYSPSIFSRKKVQSMPFSGIRTGRTAAYSWRARRNRLLALTILGQGSPDRGVTKGPFTSTSQALQASSTSAGRLSFFWARSSMVMPGMVRNSTLPEAISSFNRYLATRRACSMM